MSLVATIRPVDPLMMQASAIPPQPVAEDKDRHRHEKWSSSTAGHRSHSGHHSHSSRPHGCAKRGGRPVTWIGGGGMDPKRLAGLGVPCLRELFSQVFGEQTASNNAGWLRRKLAESPDSVHGQRRSPVVRARDIGAAIWNSPNAPGEEEEEDGMADDGTCQGVMQDSGTVPASMAEEVAEQPQSSLQDTDMVYCAAADISAGAGAITSQRRSLKRSAASAESSDTLGYRSSMSRCPSSPCGSGSASPTHNGGSLSPQAHRAKCHTASTHHHHHKQQQQQQDPSLGPGPEASPGMEIRPDSFTDSYLGKKVMVYWPADRKWWAATICALEAAAQHMQLLYSDMTEEVVAGGDFRDLLNNGHLALAAGEAPPGSIAGVYSSEFEFTDQALQSVVVPDASLAATPGLPALVSPGLPAADLVARSPALALLGDGRRSQSCLLPGTVCDSRGLYQEFTRSASVSFGVSGRISGTGSGSGGEVEELAAKRPCYEGSANTSGGSDATNAPDGFKGFVCESIAAPQQQQQQQEGADASKLAVWFASQQRQQQQLQLQMQANMQMQQQANMQMHQQMAAHMSMQHAAGQLMHLQAPALSAPNAAAAAIAGPDAMAVSSSSMPAPQTASPFAGCAAFPAGSVPSNGAAVPAEPAPAAARISSSSEVLAEEILQLKQLQLQLRQAVSQPSFASSSNPSSNPSWTGVQCGRLAAALGAAAGGPTATGINQQQQQAMFTEGVVLRSRAALPNMPQQQMAPPRTLQGSSSLPSGSTPCSPKAAAPQVVAPAVVPGGVLAPAIAGAAAGAAGACGMQRQGSSSQAAVSRPSDAYDGLAALLGFSINSSCCGTAAAGDGAAAAAGSQAAAAAAQRKQGQQGQLPQPQLEVNVFVKVEDDAAGMDSLAGDLQEGAPDDIDTILSKPDEIFDLAGLGMDDDVQDQAEGMQGMDSMAESLGGNGGGGGGGGNPSSSCGDGGGSLCESVADELAVAGLDADDAPGYYIFGGSGSSRKQDDQAAALAGPDSSLEVGGDGAGGDGMGLDCCTCVGAGDGDDDGYEAEFRRSEPGGDSFALMFNFD